MGHDIVVLPRTDQQLLILKQFEKFQQAARRCSCLIEQIDGNLIRRPFLGAGEFHQVLDCDASACGGARSAYTAVFRQNAQRNSDELPDQGLGPGIVECAFQAGKVSAGDMANFVCHYTDDLGRAFSCHQQPGGNEYALSTRNEGVKCLVIDDVKAEVLLVDSGGAKKWRNVCPNGMFDFRIADSGSLRRA
jgi:hypothetical protein